MRVVVTGIGCVSAIGLNVQETAEALTREKSGLQPLSLFESKYKNRMPAGEVKAGSSDLVNQLGLKPSKTYSRTALLGMTAAREAYEDAGLNARETKCLRIGLISGTSIGGMDRSEIFYDDYLQSASKGRLRNIISHDCGAGTENIAAYLKINDYITTISTACSSSANAIMVGARLIKHDFLDCAVVGGTDALCRFTLNGFASLKILDENHCRPFDARRGGLNLGEGAGYLILEKETNRFPKAYGCIAGYANVCEAFHQTAAKVEGTGAWLSMHKALQTANLSPDKIDYINLHGTGTANNDWAEGNAVRKLFGDSPPYLSSTKSFTGHTLGACGGIEAVFSLLAIKNGATFPNLNFETPMPEHGLIPETRYTENRNIGIVLSNSFGFGGNMSTLIFTRL